MLKEQKEPMLTEMKEDMMTVSYQIGISIKRQKIQKRTKWK